MIDILFVITLVMIIFIGLIFIILGLYLELEDWKWKYTQLRGNYTDEIHKLSKERSERQQYEQKYYDLLENFKRYVDNKTYLEKRSDIMSGKNKYSCTGCRYLEHYIIPIREEVSKTTTFMQSVSCKKGNSARIKLELQEHPPCNLYSKIPKIKKGE